MNIRDVPIEFENDIKLDEYEDGATGSSTLILSHPSMPGVTTKRTVAKAIGPKSDTGEVIAQLLWGLWAMHPDAFRDEDEGQNFADAPQSVNELRADKTMNAKYLTPRDLGVMFLREIDQGELHDVDTAVIGWRHKYKEPKADGSTVGVGFLVASNDIHITAGLLEDLKRTTLEQSVVEPFND